MRITPKAQSPEAFVKGIAYGVLHAAAIGSKHAVLVAADAPLAPGKKPQHAIQVAMLDAEGQGPLLRVTGPGGDATHAALARSEQPLSSSKLHNIAGLLLPVSRERNGRVCQSVPDNSSAETSA